MDAKVGFKPTLSELEIEFENLVLKSVISFSNTKGEKYSIGYDSESNQFFSDRSQAGDHSFSKEFFEKIDIAPRFTGKNNTVKSTFCLLTWLRPNYSQTMAKLSHHIFSSQAKISTNLVFNPPKQGSKSKLLKIWSLKNL